MPEPLTLLPEDPTAVGPYRLEGRLGSGGQGVVYAGRAPGDGPGDGPGRAPDGGPHEEPGHAPDGARVAVKLLHPHLIADGEARMRFLREVETAKRVAPFCTAQLLDSGFAGARPYIVSEFVDGPSLQESVRESGPRGAAALQRLAVNTATALAAIHAAGVVHRDFKPGNVLLGPDGPVVIDFGIAKALDLSQSVVTSQPIGSPAYMAPEQIAGGDVGPAADLFAWAATMFYAATGRLAFTGDTIPATLHSVLQSEPDLSPFEGRLGLLLRECLAKDPALRPTAAQLVERLRTLPSPTWQDAASGTPAGPAVSSSTGPAGPNPAGPAVSNPTGPASRIPTGPAAQGPTGHSPASKVSGRRGFAVASATAALIVAAGIGIAVYALSPATAQRQVAAGPAVSTSAPPPSASPSTTAPSAYELLVTRTPGKATDLAPASPTKAPQRSTATPTRDRDSTPGSSPTSASKTRKPTPRPTRQSPSSTATAGKEPSAKPSLQPSTGTVTWTDASAYCKSLGHTVSFSGGWSGMKCTGTDTPVTPSALCQWKYPAYSHAVADPPVNPFTPVASCSLS
ncbi:protein kinase [Nonomuraea sp. NPDC049709]|uniref:serine/threonine protein kinase n=1 Tax=Nonomuraea sp. NPDC049709 TaxID=3154736 RepID=UPI0034141978